MVTTIFTAIGALVTAFALFTGMAYLAGRLGVTPAYNFARYVLTILRMGFSPQYFQEVLSGQAMVGAMEVAEKLATMDRAQSRRFLRDLRKVGRS